MLYLWYLPRFYLLYICPFSLYPSFVSENKFGSLDKACFLMKYQSMKCSCRGMRGRYRLVDSVDSVDSVDMMVDKKLCYLYVRVCVSHLVTETRLQTVQCDGQQIVWPGPAARQMDQTTAHSRVENWSSCSLHILCYSCLLMAPLPWCTFVNVCLLLWISWYLNNRWYLNI